MNKSVDTTCGIYSTEYRLIKHRNGSISVKAPYIKWTNNCGVLEFRVVPITRFSRDIINAFKSDDAGRVAEYLSYNE